MTPFDFVNAINLSKKDLIAEDPSNEKEYTKHKFIINRAFGYFYDTVLPANAMNMYSDIPSKWQNKFFLNIISKNKRFSKWVEKEPKSESLELVKEYYGYSSEKAKDALKILSDKDLMMIKEKLYKGGK
jgi:hypothetical protein